MIVDSSTICTSALGAVSAEVADRRSSCESDANIHDVSRLEVFTDLR